ncbi:Major capsid protein [Clarias magur]|uniref:Major capsid protein n=1 Tax=Clarias magur TaxID=1594786 RepID=A0A8J4X6C1_CLAMG|nr:Major capsid protein [Clarias magur]
MDHFHKVEGEHIAVAIFHPKSQCIRGYYGNPGRKTILQNFHTTWKGADSWYAGFPRCAVTRQEALFPLLCHWAHESGTLMKSFISLLSKQR